MFGYKHDCGSSMVKILGSDLKTRLSVFEKKYENAEYTVESVPLY
jgi:hypothetical protein